MKYIVNVAVNIVYVSPVWIPHASTSFVYRRVSVCVTEITVARLLTSPYVGLRIFEKYNPLKGAHVGMYERGTPFFFFLIGKFSAFNRKLASYIEA
jgi:hypothetical protein